MCKFSDFFPNLNAHSGRTFTAPPLNFKSSYAHGGLPIRGEFHTLLHDLRLAKNEYMFKGNEFLARAGLSSRLAGVKWACGYMKEASSDVNLQLNGLFPMP